MTRTGLFRYVTPSQIDAFHRRGWMVVSDLFGCHHGAYAVLMWHCDCEVSNDAR